MNATMAPVHGLATAVISPLGTAVRRLVTGRGRAGGRWQGLQRVDRPMDLAHGPGLKRPPIGIDGRCAAGWAEYG